MSSDSSTVDVRWGAHTCTLSLAGVQAGHCKPASHVQGRRLCSGPPNSIDRFAVRESAGGIFHCFKSSFLLWLSLSIFLSRQCCHSPVQTPMGWTYKLSASSTKKTVTLSYAFLYWEDLLDDPRPPSLLLHLQLKFDDNQLPYSFTSPVSGKDGTTTFIHPVSRAGECVAAISLDSCAGRQLLTGNDKIFIPPTVEP